MTGVLMHDNLERTLAFYSKDDDNLVGEYPLAGVPLADLRDLFGLSGDDPMIEVFPVGHRQTEYLGRKVPAPIDLSRYDYFVECHELSSS
jgi:hypothetical protein